MKESKDDDTIKVNRRSGDRPIFESNFIQQISDGIDLIKDESKEVLRELDKANISEVDIEEVGESTYNHISDVADELSQLKSKLINTEEFPEPIKESSRNIKSALNRDEDYVRRARRRLDRIDSNDFVNVYKANIRVVELCDKALKVDKSNQQAYYLKGLALTNLEKYPEAIEEFTNSLALKDDMDSWLGIADANRLNKDYEDALGVYDLVLEKDEESYEAFIGKAYTYYAIRDYSNANIEFKKASTIQPLDIEAKKIWDECLES